MNLGYWWNKAGSGAVADPPAGARPPRDTGVPRIPQRSALGRLYYPPCMICGQEAGPNPENAAEFDICPDCRRLRHFVRVLKEAMTRL